MIRRPILRYHGGKWMVAPWIISHFGEHRVYVEPYGGAASVLLRKPPAYAEIYNDLDDDVVNLFAVLRDPIRSKRLQEWLGLTPFSREEFDLAFKSSRVKVEAARRLIVRSFMGFGTDASFGRVTGFRSDSNRSGTTPAHDWKNYSSSLQPVIDRLASVVIESRPALEIIRQHDGPDTLLYIDPPYPHATRSQGNPHCKKHLYRHELSDDDHVSLLAELQTAKSMVVLSSYPNQIYSDILTDWLCVEQAAKADGARDRTECLWLNPAAINAMPQQDMFQSILST